MEVDDPKLVFISLDQADKATGLCNVIRDYHCLVHPEKGIVLYQIEPKRKGQLIGARLQGNKDIRVTEMLHKHYPWAEIKQIPLVIVPINPSDY
ncbi:hypothetical protein [Rhizobium phage RHph_X3_15]|nr:hypothetical protein [Rhizobium phage RHph_X3_15]